MILKAGMIMCGLMNAHAHCSMHDILCHALSAHSLHMGDVEARACDSRALKNISCSLNYGLKYEILNQLTYITTSLKRSDSANRTIAGNSYADAETSQHSPLR